MVQLADHAGVIFTQGAPPVGQDPQHRQLGVAGHGAQPAHAGGGQRDRVRVGGVGLAALPGGKYPYPGRQLGRHVDDSFAIGEQPVRHVPADTLASLNCPDPLRPRRHRRQHRRIPSGVGAIPAAAYDSLFTGHDLDRGGALVRVHPDNYQAHHQSSSSLLGQSSSKEGTATSSRANPS
jgi:hypothetical protein